MSTETPQEIDITTISSIIAVPPENLPEVQVEKKKLHKSINLEALVTDLGILGSFIRIAYNGVGAAGPKFTDNQIEIQRVAYDITKLCDKSAITISKFKSASKIVITDLQASYGFLLDGFDQVAVDTLANIKKVAAGMKEAALELHKDFEKQAEKVVATLESTQKSKGEALKNEGIKKDRNELEQKRRRADEKAREAALLAQDEEAKRQRYELEQDESIRRIGEQGLIVTLVNALTTKMGFGQLMKGKDYRAQADEFKKKRLEALEAVQAAQKERAKQLDEMVSFAVELSNCDADTNMAQVAVEALHKAVSALKKLSAIMMGAAQFWRQMEEHCQCLSEDAITSIVDSVMKITDDSKRLKFWNGETFATRAKQFYVGWVALHSVCDAYMARIKLTQKDLYKYLEENPTYEESKDKVKELAEIFLGDLKLAQQDLSDKKFANEKEICLLTAEF